MSCQEESESAVKEVDMLNQDRLECAEMEVDILSQDMAENYDECFTMSVGTAYWSQRANCVIKCMNSSKKNLQKSPTKLENQDLKKQPRQNPTLTSVRLNWCVTKRVPKTTFWRDL